MLPGSGAPAGAHPMAAPHAVHDVTNYWLGQGVAGAICPCCICRARRTVHGEVTCCHWSGNCVLRTCSAYCAYARSDGSINYLRAAADQYCCV